jgi:hypothetical protein
MSELTPYQHNFLKQLPHLAPLDPRERAVTPLTSEAMGLFVGAAALLLGPSMTPKPCLIAALHEPGDDDALTIDGQIVQFAGQRPRVDLLWLRQKNEAELEAERQERARYLLAHANQFAAHESVVPMRLPQLWPFEIMRAEKVPHNIDAEQACLLADGNTQNLVNCFRYVAVHSMQAR